VPAEPVSEQIGPRLERVAIIGLGLMGGSIAAAIKARNMASVVTAFDLAPDELAQGLSLGVIDEAASSVAEAVRLADLVVIAVPVLAIESLLIEIGNSASTSAIITDVGSVKSSIIEAARRQVPKLLPRIIPGHPIAGSEQHGVQAANANLFVRHKVILTALLETEPASLALVKAFWVQLGADVVEMTPAHHDAVLAQTSHLPHLLAYALIDTLSMQGDSLEIFEYAAGGLRDFSRIAASDPVMWRDIYQANSGPVLEILDRYMKELLVLRQLIESGRSTELTEVLTRAKLARDHFSVLLSQRDQPYNTKEKP
jgi:cyclohexadieny/prephenate dehydrogenase / 3-phosphoshikimate 1-carboxyvinyltransferase